MVQKVRVYDLRTWRSRKEESLNFGLEKLLLVSVCTEVVYFLITSIKPKVFFHQHYTHWCMEDRWKVHGLVWYQVQCFQRFTDCNCLTKTVKFFFWSLCEDQQSEKFLNKKISLCCQVQTCYVSFYSYYCSIEFYKTY